MSQDSVYCMQGIISLRSVEVRCPGSNWTAQQQNPIAYRSSMQRLAERIAVTITVQYANCCDQATGGQNVAANEPVHGRLMLGAQAMIRLICI